MQIQEKQRTEYKRRADQCNILLEINSFRSGFGRDQPNLSRCTFLMHRYTFCEVLIESLSNSMRKTCIWKWFFTLCVDQKPLQQSHLQTVILINDFYWFRIKFRRILAVDGCGHVRSIINVTNHLRNAASTLTL